MTITPQLFDRYLAGESSADEGRTVERWMAADPENMIFVESVREQAGTPAQVIESVHEEMVWARIHTRIAPSQSTVSAASTSRSVATTLPVRQRSRRPWMLPVASVLALMVGIWGYTAIVPHVRPTTPVSAERQVYTTPRGQRLAVTLSDGSQVVLNADSRLEVARTFGTADRAVTLIGEAAFAVANSRNVPFTVTAGSTHTSVLGTAFAVRAYPQDTAVRITVKSGRLNVDGVTLAPRDVGMFTPAKTEVWHDQPVDGAWAFTEHKLVLDGRPMRAMADDIERWYGITLRFGSPHLATQQIEATLTGGSVDDLAGMLELLLDARVVRNGRVLTLYAQPGAKP